MNFQHKESLPIKYPAFQALDFILWQKRSGCLLQRTCCLSLVSFFVRNALVVFISMTTKMSCPLYLFCFYNFRCSWVWVKTHIIALLISRTLVSAQRHWFPFHKALLRNLVHFYVFGLTSAFFMHTVDVDT